MAIVVLYNLAKEKNENNLKQDAAKYVLIWLLVK